VIGRVHSVEPRVVERREKKKKKKNKRNASGLQRRKEGVIYTRRCGFIEPMSTSYEPRLIKSAAEWTYKIRVSAHLL
jgi:hypothetical protein